MSFSYSSGQRMPASVEETIRYLAKVGVITTAGWRRAFGVGSERWQRGMLSNLQKRNVLSSHTCSSVSDAWVLGSWAKDILRLSGQNYVSPVQPQQISHDETVGLGMLELSKANAVKLWFSERELKMMRPKELGLNLGKAGTKYPDATMAFQKNGKVWLVALEYERTGKDTSRYQSIMKAYGALEGIHQIVFIAEDLSISERIKKVCRSLGEGRCSFVTAKSWKESAVNAEIEKNEKTITFKELLGLASDKADPNADPQRNISKVQAGNQQIA